MAAMRRTGRDRDRADLGSPVTVGRAERRRGMGPGPTLRAVVFATLCLAGCIPTPSEREPLAVAQASTDLACAERDLTPRYLGERLFQVTGCGRSATYRVICKLTVHTCYLLGGPD